MNTMCRACLLIAEDMVMMDKGWVDKYNDFTNIGVKHNEDDPIYICQACLDIFNYCMQFREKCISSDKKLKEMLDCKSQTILKVELNDELRIKEEVKLEYDSDAIMHEDNDPYFHLNNDSDSDTKLSILKKAKTQVKRSTRLARNKRKKISNETDEDNKADVKWKSKKETILITIETEDKLNCGICPKIFADMETLVKHLERHKDGGCDICSEKFLDFTETVAHRIVHLPDNQKKCHICSRKYNKVDTLEYHYLRKHNHRSTDPKLYCKVCRKPFKGSKAINNHMRSVHWEHRYKCSVCDKGFRERSALNSHMLTHKEDKILKCELCDFSCKRSCGMNEHTRRRHMPDSVLCKVCGRVFENQSYLDKHVCKHALRVICPICGVIVSKSILLKRHMASHEEKKKIYSCDRCDAKFVTKQNFKIHSNKHDGIKPYRCEYCQMNFYSMPVLIKHRRTHTGERPYKCKLCDSAFTGNHNLKVHMKVHGLDLIVKRDAQPNTPKD